MKILSPVFRNKRRIPSKYSCDGENINPPLQFFGVPEEAKSLALIMDDPDAVSGTWVHWLVWNIDASVLSIAEDSVPLGAMEGVTSSGLAGYGGPCPPLGTHRYFFKLFALNYKLDLSMDADRRRVEKAMEGHIIGKAELIGLYAR